MNYRQGNPFLPGILSGAWQGTIENQDRVMVLNSFEVFENIIVGESILSFLHGTSPQIIRFSLMGEIHENHRVLLTYNSYDFRISGYQTLSLCEISMELSGQFTSVNANRQQSMKGQIVLKKIS